MKIQNNLQFLAEKSETFFKQMVREIFTKEILECGTMFIESSCECDLKIDLKEMWGRGYIFKSDEFEFNNDSEEFNISLQNVSVEKNGVFIQYTISYR
ncbi:MAG: hypothetical protein P1Q69_10550 [Candidatus Thorarchaeota archaeon]|nr:hypothetical protein [Candidatus Thorarchaeota archaeon]